MKLHRPSRTPAFRSGLFAGAVLAVLAAAAWVVLGRAGSATAADGRDPDPPSAPTANSHLGAWAYDVEAAAREPELLRLPQQKREAYLRVLRNSLANVVYEFTADEVRKTQGGAVEIWRSIVLSDNEQAVRLAMRAPGLLPFEMQLKRRGGALLMVFPSQQPSERALRRLSPEEARRLGATGPSPLQLESDIELRKLFDASKSYYEDVFDEAPSLKGTPRQFPDSAPLTPAARPCERPGRQIDTTHLEDWPAHAWQALNFATLGPTRLQYQYLSEGRGLGARFTARAVGDFDCDGVLSTFERQGRIGPDGKVLDASGGLKVVSGAE